MKYIKEFRETIEKRVSSRTERTFGFEYELIGEYPLSLSDLNRVRGCVSELGFAEKNGLAINGSGMYVTFEPGGQIEFSSPPVYPGDLALFDLLLEQIEKAVAYIEGRTGIRYLPVGYMPGRNAAPMLLEAQRYRDLHELLGRTSDRGWDMMKGTAAIHFHAAVCSFEELLTLWEFMCALSKEDGYAMGTERRDIWNRTDPSRCGLTCAGAENISTSDELLEKLVEFALNALDLHSGIPFRDLDPDPGFREFLVHFTTIFTDVRLNTKGMTLELRTPDSRPLHHFRGAWITFLDMVQQMMDDKSRF